MKWSRKNASRACELTASASHFESLEARQLMAAQISFPDFSSTTGLAFNGFTTPTTNANRLQMTTRVNAESRSVWYQSAVPTSQFRTDFTFRIGSGADTADGLTFTLQNNDTTQKGFAGKYLGYSGITKSAAAAFNFFNFSTEGSKFGFAKNGQIPPDDIDLAPLDLHSGHLFHASVSYDGHVMRLEMFDATDRTKRFSSAKVMDLGTILGGDTAFVGFTASTGTRNSNQFISSWSYTGSNGPAVTGMADPSPVTGTTTNLTATGTDDAGHGTLSYSWATVSRPAGAKAVRFSDNNTATADDITALFSKDGTYRFRVTATDADGFSGTDLVSVVVQETATSIRIEPHKETIANGDTQLYRGTVYNQFDRELRTQPTLTFSATGPGTINTASGVFTASKTQVGHIVIFATAGDLTGAAGGTVLPA